MSLISSTQTLRVRQIANLKKMLHLNVDVDNELTPSASTTTTTTTTEENDLIWKVLILDNKSTAIVSSVLRVNDLLEFGITVHALINQRRAQLQDVPVIYFVEPTTENISIIINDLENDQYSQFYINFTSSLSRSLLEEFAKKVALTGKSNRIKQIFDQYVDFIVTEPNLYSLNLNDIYFKFNNPKTTENIINETIESISNGIFSSILTMGSIPIIRSNKGGPAELISQRLDEKLRDHVINTRRLLINNPNSISLNSTNNLNNDKSVLILLDRNINLTSMFAHSWIYQCMVSDVFKLERNTIKIEKKENLNDDKFEIKKFDIEPKDFFWNLNSSLPFPDAVENVEKELNKYTNDAKLITAKTGYSSIQDIDINDQSDTQHIQEAIKLLPELSHRKNIIDMHMTVLSDLIKELDSKNLDSFFEIEQNLNDPKVQKQFLDILSKNSKADNSKDKLRTYIILYLSCDLSKSFCDECESKLINLNIDLSPLNYVKKVKEFSKLTEMSLLSTQTNSNNDSSSYLSNNNALFSNLSSKLINLTDGSNKLTEGFGSLVSGIKKLLPEKTHLAVTNITESIMNPNQANTNYLKMTDDYLYFDPNITRGSHSKQPKRKTYNEGMVFIVGGGNYSEYSNLQDWCNDWNIKQGTLNGSVNGSSPTKMVCYGSTEILTADDFIKECTELANQ
ncbi:Vesicle trafficking between the ER and Golgi [Pichia californica]|uniref:Vesicle trafficking between the ER and Golgi n=1 Tax=Pichia californica TaxID=460514 RepID=A0A9P6WID9_9ASCO|nr:Vesicle trafficking between the ER and Golgi [[Candida] californica]KAG0687491.1 Vesicle trafficking between the ER and Golgi [[Candida] californica]